MTEQSSPHTAADAADPATPPAAPAGGGSGPAVAALQQTWSGFGRWEQFAVGGSVAAFIAYLLGAIVEGWSLSSTGPLTFLVASVVLAVAVVGRTAPAASALARPAVIRGAGAVLGVFGITDFGDALGNLADWSAITIILTIVAAAGAVVAAWGAIALTRGDVVADGTSLLGGSRPLTERLLVGGAVGIAVAWFVILLGNHVNMITDSDLALIAAILAVTTAWAARTGAIRSWPLRPDYIVGALTAFAGIVVVLWLVRFAGTFTDGGIFTLVGVLLYVAATAALVAGGLLPLRDRVPATAS